MEKLVLNPSPLAQWYALVEEAKRSTSVNLNLELESYLIFLLMRFTKNPDFLNNVVALEFLQNLPKTNRQNRHNLKEVGDKCLIFSGLFPKNARRRLVDISYYVKIGQSAYSSLSEDNSTELASLFGQLGSHFVELMDILHTIRGLNPHTEELDLLEAESLWQQTHSQHALQILKKATKGFLIPNSYPPTIN